MDRCHRLGQDKPVLVLRLATAHSVEGKLLKRANSKLALERLVIKKGAFLPSAEQVSMWRALIFFSARSRPPLSPLHFSSYLTHTTHPHPSSLSLSPAS